MPAVTSGLTGRQHTTADRARLRPPSPGRPAASRPGIARRARRRLSRSSTSARAPARTSPPDRLVVAVEPSGVMIAQRPPDAAPGVRADRGGPPLPRRRLRRRDGAPHGASLDRLPARPARDAAAVARRVVVLTWDPDVTWSSVLVRARLLPRGARGRARSADAAPPVASARGRGDPGRPCAARLHRRILRRVLAAAGRVSRPGRRAPRSPRLRPTRRGRRSARRSSGSRPTSLGGVGAALRTPACARGDRPRLPPRGELRGRDGAPVAVLLVAAARRRL